MDHFRRVLKIRVDEDNRVSACRIDAGGHGNLVAKVPGEADEFDSRVLSRKTFQKLACPVTAPIIDKNQFSIEIMKLGTKRPQPFHGFPDYLFLVITGDDNGY